MGILSRFRDIMAGNVNALLHKAENPEKTIDEYMRKLNHNLGKVKAETASVLSDEQRAKRVLDECNAEIKKFQRYADKSLEAGNEDEALKFLDRKMKQSERLLELQTAYEQASLNVERMKQIRDKLTSDMALLEARRMEVKEKIANVKMQQILNSGNSSFAEMEEQVEDAMYEAEALAELRSGTEKGDLKKD